MTERLPNSSRIAANVAEIRARIAAAAARAGRRADEIRLLAVTKYFAPDAVRAIVAAGCTELGESRPQQLWQRAELFRDLPIRWHMIGHLQRNKVERTVPLVSLMHSVDSLRLAEAIDAAAGRLAGEKTGTGSEPSRATSSTTGSETPVPVFSPSLRVPVLLEVNVAGEAAKHGLAPAEVEPLLPALAGLAHLEVRGLMCMAALEGGSDEARRDFARLRELRDRLRSDCPAGMHFDELSMGMSGDYEIAIEEGATIVRIGSALVAEA